jgi:hypothetical protein
MGLLETLYHGAPRVFVIASPGSILFERFRFDVREHGSLSSAFDHALELQELQEAAEAYASRHGEPGSEAYREAWMRFRRRVRTVEDLRRMRARAAESDSDDRPAKKQ